MTPEQALAVLDQALQPSAKLTRQDYLLVEQALQVLAKLVQETKEKKEDIEKKGGVK